MVNSISNVPPSQNQHNIVAQAQPLQNKEAINERTAVVQAKNEKKVKEDKEKKEKNSKRSKAEKIDEALDSNDVMDHSIITFSNIFLAQETEQTKRQITPAKAAGVYKSLTTD